MDSLPINPYLTVRLKRSHRQKAMMLIPFFVSTAQQREKKNSNIHIKELDFILTHSERSLPVLNYPLAHWGSLNFR